VRSRQGPCRWALRCWNRPLSLLTRLQPTRGQTSALLCRGAPPACAPVLDTQPQLPRSMDAGIFWKVHLVGLPKTLFATHSEDEGDRCQTVISMRLCGQRHNAFPAMGKGGTCMAPCMLYRSCGNDGARPRGTAPFAGCLGVSFAADIRQNTVDNIAAPLRTVQAMIRLRLYRVVLDWSFT